MPTLSTQNNQPIPGLPSPSSNSIMASRGGPTNQDVARTGLAIDQLAVLLPLTWTANGMSIPFPATHFKETSSHALAMHEYPNVDGARIEPTGRNPSMYQVRAILTNNIFPGPNEDWIQGTLYPDTFNNLQNAFLKDSQSATPGVLQHPSLGNITCRIHSWTYDYIGKGPRDGVFMDITFIETIGQQPLLQTIFTLGDGLGLLNTVSAILDREVATSPLPNNIPNNSSGGANSFYTLPLSPPGLSLSGFFSAISTQISNFVGFANQVIPAINFNIYSSANTSANGVSSQGQLQINLSKITVLNATISSQLNYNAQALNNVYSSVYSLNNSLNNNPTQLINNTINFYSNLLIYYKSFNQIETANMELYLYQAIQALQQSLPLLTNNNQGYIVNQYYVKNDTSLISLTRLLNNTIDQLIALNPSMEQYLVPANTLVNFYQG